MSDSEDFDDGYYDDVGYFYIEDAYAPADELAEHTCPSPIPFEEEEWDDHSRFTSYWNDLKYNSDSYYDKTTKRKKRSRKPTKGAPKKKTEQSGPPRLKKRKTQHSSRSNSPILFTDDIPPILWMSQKKRSNNTKTTTMVEGGPVALFGDWRERFANVSGFPSTSRPTKLAEVGHFDEEGAGDVLPATGLQGSITGSRAVKPISKRRLEVLKAETEEDELDGLELDPETLKLVLRQHLQAAGVSLKGIDESTLLQLATRMFSNQDGADDIAGDLATTLLGHDEDDESEENGFAVWVAEQVEKKVQNGAMKGDVLYEEQSPNHPQSSAQSSRVAELDKAEAHPVKRKADASADDAIGDEMPEMKRRARSYEKPTTASKARVRSNMKGKEKA